MVSYLDPIYLMDKKRNTKWKIETLMDEKNVMFFSLIQVIMQARKLNEHIDIDR